MKLWGIVLVVVAASGWWLLRTREMPPLLSVDRPDQPPVQLVAEDDAGLEAASEQARASIDTLLAELARRNAPRPQAQVKVRIEDAGVVEHVWLVDLRYEAGMLYGAVGNEPLQLEHWRQGDPAMVDPREITDWLLIDERGVQGGFTLLETRSRLTSEQRRRFDEDFFEHFGVWIEEAAHVR